MNERRTLIKKNLQRIKNTYTKVKYIVGKRIEYTHTHTLKNVSILCAAKRRR